MDVQALNMYATVFPWRPVTRFEWWRMCALTFGYSMLYFQPSSRTPRITHLRTTKAPPISNLSKRVVDEVYVELASGLLFAEDRHKTPHQRSLKFGACSGPCGGTSRFGQSRSIPMPVLRYCAVKGSSRCRNCATKSPARSTLMNKHMQ